MAKLRTRMTTYEGENLDRIILPKLSPGEPEIVPVTHDETILYANDGMNKYWSPMDEYNLRKKSQGLSIHVSDFYCESIGRLKLSEYEITINDLLPDYMRLKYTQA
ncbi:7832_t:CDS:2, partial [Dentiscutata erythropus]